MNEPTGADLIDKWTNRTAHPYEAVCPGCGESSNVAITTLVYDFTICECEHESARLPAGGFHPHLVERIWHRRCFPAAPD